ncbi:MAG TPA: hypothetical protein VMR25_11245 [Planctomycetaceae bacterium]|jgi:hypothetical protein|nr:hypothetical protein [Planctomycetaceae bacterium]
MKVITQLVQHFWQRGALTAADAAYLVRSGFVRAGDLAGFKLPSDDEPPVPETSVNTPTPVGLRALEAVQESLIRHGKRRRKKGGPKTAVVQPKELCARLKTDFGRRVDYLQNLLRLCEPKSSAATWEEAAAELRRLAPAKCRSVLASRLRQGAVGLAGLWNAVDLEPFHHLLSEDEVRGRTARAYFALLVAQDAASLGGYGWILKYDDVQAVANLQCVHQRLMETLCQLYSDDRRTLTRCLANGSTPVATWSLILLYNANRSDRRTANARTEFGPVEPADSDVWKQAWTAALEMDRVHVAQLLVECYGSSAIASPVPPGGTSTSLYCPKGWHLPQDACSA